MRTPITLAGFSARHTCGRISELTPTSNRIFGAAEAASRCAAVHELLRNFDSDFACLLLTDQPLTNWWALRLRMLQAAIYILIPKCCGSACSGDQCAVSLRLAGVFGRCRAPTSYLAMEGF
jgi:hypothetical protein